MVAALVVITSPSPSDTLNNSGSVPHASAGFCVNSRRPALEAVFRAAADPELQLALTWRDKAAYDSAAREVAKRFETNFAKFEPYVDGPVKAAAIHAAA